MVYKLAADGLMVLHFAWILFMLYGFWFTFRAFFKPELFERWLFRSLHLLGIAFVAFLVAIGKPCPSTIWENDLRRLHDPSSTYPGSFIVAWIERLVYPDVPLLVITIPTFLLALFTLVVYIWRPPSRVRNWLKKRPVGHDRS